MLDIWRDFLADVDDQQLQELVRERELGQLNFESAVSQLSVIRDLISALSVENESELPSALPQEVTQHIETLKGIIQQMREFTLAQDQASTQQSGLNDEVNREREWFVAVVKPQLRAPIVDMSAKLAEITTAHGKAVAEASEVDRLVAQIRLGAGEAGANQLAAYYESQATTHKESAARFFVAVLVLLAAATALVIYGFVLHPIPLVTEASSDIRWEEFLRGLVLRLVLLGLGSFGLALLARNYRVNKHLQVVNETKRNALNTYVLFAEAASTDETRALITAELVRAVFLPGDSGYLGEKADRTVIESTPSLMPLLRPPS